MTTEPSTPAATPTQHPLRVVTPGALADRAQPALRRLIDERFASRLAAGDATIWGADAQPEAAKRLGWVHADAVSAPLVDEIIALRDHLHAQGVDRIVLAGMGGSSLAPEVITIAADVALHILDTTDPQQLRRVLDHDIERTALVVSSKSGSTLETDSQRRAFAAAFTAAGIDPADRIVIVTDPGSPLDALARQAGHHVFNADPNVGGRYSALTAFGLVPSGLAGADIAGLLADAHAALPALLADAESNPALQLAAALAADPEHVDKFAVACEDAGRLTDLPAWIEQLVAESTGKLGRGVLPIAVDTGEFEVAAGDRRDSTAAARLAELTGAPRPNRPADVVPVAVVDALPDAPADHAVWVAGSLGAQFMTWEIATAALGLLLGINPFDQPDVESAKAAARDLLEHPVEGGAPLLVDDTLALFVPGTDEATSAIASASTLEGALRRLLGQVDPALGYVAVQVYADREGLADLGERRGRLAAALRRPVTFGWGPRFLHSTGQYHKGGPAQGVFLQLTRVSDDPLPIPERPFGFAQLIRAQATGDAQVLAAHGLPVLRIEASDDAGLARALDVAVRVASQVTDARDSSGAGLSGRDTNSQSR
ncbi:glucose-6-phosphate isomerase [Pseudoclavibacter sp. CFCC 13796]|uniref:glucose-6-phosphate isomerase n=1 Tax=Pseudoclavibacter sp. CFCC 13796 TaxID=2615179 RepID=UPI0013019183|nr:glucose-6-phosphate isomerase [Pseudoclavibacter sp. CFCC 13796]KAB1661798.1 glucose-6-phosphate isomerase [Pseudoclavibacter sp. CFCC 13796]